jgi:hypothetical protein
MTVRELIEQLEKQPQDARVQIAVSWAKDTAVGDGNDVTVDRLFDYGDDVVIGDWIADCNATL